MDEETNGHGLAFIDFLLEGKPIILNRWVCPLEDNYTCILTKGKSISDYVATAHENMKNVTRFAVVSTSDMVERLHLQVMCEHRISDHSLLLFEFPYAADSQANANIEEVHPLNLTEVATAGHGRDNSHSRNQQQQAGSLRENEALQALNPDEPLVRYKVKNIAS